MVFQPFFLSDLIQKFGNSSDYLLGNPFTSKSFSTIVTNLKQQNADGLFQVQWLIDTKERLQQYLQIAQTEEMKIRVNLEIDIGLHRGGATSKSELLDMMDIIAQNTNNLIFSGFMGYDGHVAFTPWGTFEGKKKAMKNALNSCVSEYQKFVEYGKGAYPTWFNSSMDYPTLNGAGSNTVTMYKEISNDPMNDFAIGSGFLKPGDFDVWTLTDFTPAMYYFGPIVKVVDFPIPFMPLFLWNFLKGWNPNYKQSFFLSGVDLAGNVESPGIVTDYITSEHPGAVGAINLLPTQSLYHASTSVTINVDDFVFFRPLESDAMIAFDSIYLIRNGTVTGHWDTYKGGL